MKRDGVKQMIRGLISTLTHSPITEEAPSFDYFANFFDVEDSSCKHDDLDEFLVSRITDLSLLDMYPSIKEVFIKHNTPSQFPTSTRLLNGYLAIGSTCKRNAFPTNY